MRSSCPGNVINVYISCILLLGYLCVEGCEESCRFSYDQSLNEHIHRCDQTSEGHVTVTDRAHFDGNAFLSLSMFQQNPLRPSFSIAFIFRYTGRPSRNAIAILSNGCEGVEPTIEFKLETQSRGVYGRTTLNMWMTNDYTTMNISASNTKVNVHREVLVQIAQNETSVVVQVGGQPKQVYPKDVTDHIAQNNCPLQIGAGTGLDNYVGEFDEFIYFPCVNPGFFSISDLFLL